MGSQCSFKLEPEKEDLWTLMPNSTYQYDNHSGLIFIHHNLSHFLLQTNFCKSPWFKFKPELLALIIWLYSLFIIIGAVGNGMVCYAVLANRHMRTPRNLLIFNLAFSDLILCLFTQPFNLLRIATNAWKLGSFMCKLVPTASAFNVYASTFSIIAIALDRFRLIVRPTDRDFLVQPVWFIAVLASIWLVAFLFASPMLAFNTLSHLRLTRWFCIQEVCSEASEYSFYRMAYSIVTMLIQYIFPIMVLTIAHVRIINRLQNRIQSQCNKQQQQHQQQQHHQQQHQQQQQQQQSYPEKKQNYTEKQQNYTEQQQNYTEQQQQQQQQGSDKEEEHEKKEKNKQTGKTSPQTSSQCDSTHSDEQPSNHLSNTTLSSPDQPEQASTKLKKVRLLSPPRPFSDTPSFSIQASQEFQMTQLNETDTDKASKKTNRRLWRLNSLKRKPSTAVKVCQRKLSKEKRINRLLFSIALVFAASWMPLTLFNIASDVMTGTVEQIDPRGLLSALCHLLVLVSACVNPVLYGWLNENFQREFRRLLCRRRPSGPTSLPHAPSVND